MTPRKTDATRVARAVGLGRRKTGRKKNGRKSARTEVTSVARQVTSRRQGASTMRKSAHGRDLDALNANIVKSRDDIAELAAGLKKLADWQNEEERSAVEEPHNGSSNGNGTEHNGRWTALRQRITDAGSKGGKVAQGFAVEMQRHPLLGSMAVFGVGFMLATLVFKRSAAPRHQDKT
jgi:hypothetical protein